MRKAVVATLLLALMLPASASAWLAGPDVTKFPNYLRVTSSFGPDDPSCIEDEYGMYPQDCWDGDLVFRVAKKAHVGWKPVYADSTPQLIFDSDDGVDTSRIYFWEFKNYRAFSGTRKCARHRLKVTFVDAYGSSSSATRLFRACYRMR